MNNHQEETGLKHVFMFEFPKNHLSAVGYGIHTKSPSCVINNLTWRIMIIKRKSEYTSKVSAGALSIYLECSGKSQFWTCSASVRLTLLSQDLDVKDVSKEFQHLFSSSSNCIGFPTFIRWDKLHGFIKDDMIRIQAYVTADPPKNISITDYDMKRPQSCDDWLFLFENKLNDKIVRRISEEIKTVKDKMRSLDKLRGEVKALDEKVERLDNRNVRIMSEFLKKSLEIVITSFFKKIDSLQLQEKLDSFHAEMTSVLGEIRRIKPLDCEDKDNEKLRTGNDEVDSDGESQSGTMEPEETAASCEENEESETDSVIIEEKAIETIDISNSDSDNDKKITNTSASSEDTEKKSVAVTPRVVEESRPTTVSALNFFKTLVLECQKESSKCCLPSLGYGSRVCGGPNEFIARTCSEMKPASRHCPAHVRTKCESSSHVSSSCRWCNQVEVERKSLNLKRKRENDNSTCSFAGTESPKKSKYLKKDTIKDASENDSDVAVCSSASSSESSYSSSTDDENSQEKQPK